jgi:hypothetical protein
MMVGQQSQFALTPFTPQGAKVGPQLLPPRWIQHRSHCPLANRWFLRKKHFMAGVPIGA